MSVTPHPRREPAIIEQLDRGDVIPHESSATELKLEAEAYDGPVQAFNVVAGAVLTEAVNQDLISFDQNDLQMRDAMGVLNELAQIVGGNQDHPMYDKLAFLVEMHNQPEFKRTFSFGIEAVYRDGKVGIWWPQ